MLRNSVDDIFKWAEKNYDYIIIDTPPFGLLNDSNELVKYADTYLVILNARYTRRRGLAHIEEKLSLFEDTSCGVVLNGIKTTKLQRLYSRYAYKYSYNYNYGYGYGYGYGGEYGYGYGSDDSDYDEES